MSDTDTEIVALLGTRFIERRDVKAVAGEPHVEKGGPCLAWQPIRSPFTMQDFADHLSGARTFGHYLVNPEENTAKLFAFDIDLRENKAERRNARDEVVEAAYEGRYLHEGIVYPCNPREDWGKVDHPARPFLTRELARCAAVLADGVHQLGIEVAIALSGHKGLHVYAFTGSQPATYLKEAAISLIADTEIFVPLRGDIFYRSEAFPNLAVEVFPKQDNLDGKDLGNLMKLALGVHKETGKRGVFVSVEDEAITPVDPIEALTATNKAW